LDLKVKETLIQDKNALLKKIGIEDEELREAHRRLAEEDAELKEVSL